MVRKPSEVVVLIRGAGEVASGVAYRLYQYRFQVCLTEIPNPLAVSRGTAYSEAIFEGKKTIQTVTAELVPPSVAEVQRVWGKGNIPLIIDPGASIKEKLKPDVLVDAIMAKQPTGTKITDAPLVIGVGPGFYAGKDVHIVVESNDGPNLAKLIFDGEAEKNTGSPIAVGGLGRERVVWAPQAGIFVHRDREIGDPVEAGQVIADVDDIPLKAPISGNLRGIIRNGVRVSQGCKLIEIDQVNEPKTFYSIRRKIWDIGGGVAEAIITTLGGS